MPLDIDAIRQRVPDAFAREEWEAPAPDMPWIPEGDPQQIWDPRTSPVGHPLGRVEWGPESADRPEEPEDWGDSWVREVDMDLLAWYRSYHTASQSSWGIYIREWGLSYLARRLGGRPDLAFWALWSHEYFHFLVDVAATAVETGTCRPVYIPWRNRHHGGTGSPQGGVHGYCFLAESLANAFSLDQVGRRHGKGLLREFMRTQPAGYRDFGRYERRGADDRLTTGYRELGAHLGDPMSLCQDGTRAELGELLVDEDGRSVAPADVPIFVVPRARRVGGAVLSLVAALPQIYESRAFLKDVERLSLDARRRWAATKEKLARSTRETGVNLEKLRGSDDLYSVRLSRSLRAILECRGGVWTAVAVGNHDATYRRRGV